MLIYRARLRNTSNALSPRVSSEQIRLLTHHQCPLASLHMTSAIHTHTHTHCLITESLTDF